MCSLSPGSIYYMSSLQPLISIGGHLCCQHSKCEAALTYMISGNHREDLGCSGRSYERRLT